MDVTEIMDTELPMFVRLPISFPFFDTMQLDGIHIAGEDEDAYLLLYG